MLSLSSLGNVSCEQIDCGGNNMKWNNVSILFNCLEDLVWSKVATQFKIFIPSNVQIVSLFVSFFVDTSANIFATLSRTVFHLLWVFNFNIKVVTEHLAFTFTHYLHCTTMHRIVLLTTVYSVRICAATSIT